MERLTQLVQETAALMRKHNLAHVDDLLTHDKLLFTLDLNKSGLAFLKDVRRYTPTGLDNLAKEIEARGAEQRKQAVATKDQPIVDWRRRKPY